ncbi:MAG: hypothetical protein R3C10_11880 [Pirellulales bacterium]
MLNKEHAMTQAKPQVSDDPATNQPAPTNGTEPEAASPKPDQESAEDNNGPDTSSDTWIWADPNDPAFKHSFIRRQPYMAASIVNNTSSLHFNKAAVEKLA